MKLTIVKTPLVPTVLAVEQDFSTQVVVDETQRHVGNPLLEISQFSIDFLFPQVVGKS